MALTMATILTALTFSNQAFAQGSGIPIFVKGFPRNIETNLQVGKVLGQDKVPQVGQVLAGHEARVGQICTCNPHGGCSSGAKFCNVP